MLGKKDPILPDETTWASIPFVLLGLDSDSIGYDFKSNTRCIFLSINWFVHAHATLNSISSPDNEWMDRFVHAKNYLSILY